MARPRLIAPATALAILMALAVAPYVLLQDVVGDILASFHLSLAWFCELLPWVLLLAGVVFLVPVAVSAGGNPESRLYPRAWRAYFARGIVLYLMGAIMCVEILDLWSYAH